MDRRYAYHVNGLVKLAQTLIVAVLAHIIPIDRFIILIIMVTIVYAKHKMDMQRV